MVFEGDSVFDRAFVREDDRVSEADCDRDKLLVTRDENVEVLEALGDARLAVGLLLTDTVWELQ